MHQYSGSPVIDRAYRIEGIVAKSIKRKQVYAVRINQRRYEKQKFIDSYSR